jgi:hypothetical protein
MGFILIFLMPTDIASMLTVGVNLQQNGHSLIDALPFLALTLLIAALPLLAYLLLGRRAKEAMPKVRDWMSANSWLVNIIVLGIFIFLSSAKPVVSRCAWHRAARVLEANCRSSPVSFFRPCFT